MMKTLGIALGAGVTSALLVAVTTTASPTALLLAHLAPLPLMIAALGFGPPAGPAAVFVGGCALAIAVGPVAGVAFLLFLGLPAWYLARLTVSGRLAVTAAGASIPTGIAPTEWYPIGPLLLRLAALAAGPVLLAGLLVMWHYGSFEAAVSGMAGRLATALSNEPLPGHLGYAETIRYAPVFLAGSMTVMLAGNLWLAGRAVAISGRLPRPWPGLPDAVRLPPAAAALLAVLAAATLLPGAFGLAAAVMATTLGIAFAFEGLAALHVVTRGLAARRAILAAIYIVTVFVIPWLLLALVVLGCTDCLVPSLRRRAGMTLTSTPTRKQ